MYFAGDRILHSYRINLYSLLFIHFLQLYLWIIRGNSIFYIDTSTFPTRPLKVVSITYGMIKCVYQMISITVLLKSFKTEATFKKNDAQIEKKTV